MAASIQPWFTPAAYGMVAGYVDASGVTANTAFPSVSNYSDGRIITLLVAGILIFITLVAYCAGRAPPSIRGCDVYGREVELAAAPGGGGETWRPATRTSTFGGVLTVVAAVLAGGLAIDLLLQFADEFWLERSWTAGAPDGVARQANAGHVEVDIAALRAPGATTGCLVYPLAATAVVTGGWTVASRVEADGAAGHTCAITVRAAAVTLPLNVYAGAQAVAMGVAAAAPTASLSFALGAYYQVTSFTVRVYDGKPSAYTRGVLSAAMPFNATVGRTHHVGVTLTPSLFEDVAYYETDAGGRAIGYHAAFTSFVPWEAPASPALADTLVLHLTLSSSLVTTVRTPRLSILQLLGILLGLVGGIFFLMRLVHDACNALCSCTRVTRATALYRLTGGRIGTPVMSSKPPPPAPAGGDSGGFTGTRGHALTDEGRFIPYYRQDGRIVLEAPPSVAVSAAATTRPRSMRGGEAALHIGALRAALTATAGGASHHHGAGATAPAAPEPPSVTLDAPPPPLPSQQCRRRPLPRLPPQRLAHALAVAPRFDWRPPPRPPRPPPPAWS